MKGYTMSCGNVFVDLGIRDPFTETMKSNLSIIARKLWIDEFPHDSTSLENAMQALWDAGYHVTVSIEPRT